MARNWHCTVTFECPETRGPSTIRDIDVIAGHAGHAATRAFVKAKKMPGAMKGFDSVVILVEKGDTVVLPVKETKRQTAREHFAKVRKSKASASAPQNAQEGPGAR